MFNADKAYLLSCRKNFERKKDFEDDELSKLTRQRFICECGQTFPNFGTVWKKAKRHCRRCTKFVYPVVQGKWFLKGEGKQLVSVERKLIALHELSQHHEIELTEDELTALAQRQPDDDDQDDFVKPEKNFSDLYPKYYYTMCTDPIPEIEERVFPDPIPKTAASVQEKDANKNNRERQKDLFPVPYGPSPAAVSDEVCTEDIGEQLNRLSINERLRPRTNKKNYKL